MSLLTTSLPHITPLRQMTLDDLWRETETLGFVRVWTKTDYRDTKITGYKVTLLGVKRNTKMEIEREHTSLHCALADAINEGREMGLGLEG
jgi:hypothetical protein